MFRMPWMSNVQNAMDSVAHDIENMANRFAGNDRAENRRAATAAAAPPPTHADRGDFPSVSFFSPGATAAAAAAENAPSFADNQRPPPASARAIRQLPTILVAPEDLVDENNRECCICMEANCLGEKVTRLPCAHIFHSECVVDWLSNHHCTCPICRYELPTDSPVYEAGRADRMKYRKSRYARYELERMSIKDLVALNQGRLAGIGEKKDLIQFLIDENRIDLIPAPEPVAYKLEELRTMKVSQLKKTMADAGVFFHARDVVEKSDMLTIFINSGRLNVLPSEPKEVKEIPLVAAHFEFYSSSPQKRPVVETVEEYDSDCEEKKLHTTKNVFPSPKVMFPSMPTPSQSHQMETSRSMQHAPAASAPAGRASTYEPILQKPHDRVSSVDVHASLEPPTGAAVAAAAPLTSTAERLPASSCTDTTHSTDAAAQKPSSSHVQHTLPPDASSPTTSSPAAMSVESLPRSDCLDISDCLSSDDWEHLSVHEEASSKRSAASSTQSPALISVATATTTNVTDPFLAAKETRTESLNPSSPVRLSTPRESTPTPAMADCPMIEYTISQLQSLGRQSNVDLTSCFERSEMVATLLAAGVTGKATVDLQRSRFAGWSVSQLRAVASEVNIDLSQCTDQTDMLDRILDEANWKRPHLRDYLRVLSPLTRSSLSELRSTARAWDVDISDCLEKEEIIQRLITRANEFGIC